MIKIKVISNRLKEFMFTSAEKKNYWSGYYFPKKEIEL